jgi:hypothetical protein
VGRKQAGTDMVEGLRAARGAAALGAAPSLIAGERGRFLEKCDTCAETRRAPVFYITSLS